MTPEEILAQILALRDQAQAAYKARDYSASRQLRWKAFELAEQLWDVPHDTEAANTYNVEEE